MHAACRKELWKHLKTSDLHSVQKLALTSLYKKSQDSKGASGKHQISAKQSELMGKLMEMAGALFDYVVFLVLTTHLMKFTCPLIEFALAFWQQK